MRERTIPNTLLRTMSDRGMTKTELSFYAGIDLSRFSRISNGWLRASDSEQARIAEFLGLTIGQVFKEYVKCRLGFGVRRLIMWLFWRCLQIRTQ